MMTPLDPWISAAEATKRLGVTRATLYAYVSRGYIRSQIAPGSARDRRYARDDVERVRRRGEERRNPGAVATHALQWGLPILESSITLIAGGRLFYRGHDVVALARTRSVEEVASLLWTGAFASDAFRGDRPAARVRGARAVGGDLPFATRAQTALALASPADAGAFDIRPERVAITGARILSLLAETAGARYSGRRGSAHRGIAESLSDAWTLNDDGADVVRAILILCADHELNVSAFTARCVASAGANPYAVVIAGLSALEGTRHGGMTLRVESMLAALRRDKHPRRALADRLRRGERLDGFGHPLYRGGDPRAAAILALLREHAPRSAELRFATRLAESAAALTGEAPNLDFALGTAARVLGLPAGSGLALFAIGRTIGWIGQAIEQYATGEIIRPRARYAGPPPQD